jgi:uncharacterized protein (DUF1697 family)
MASQRSVALLRGINLGNKNKLPMKDLAQMFVDAGCSDVKTYIQSGNVVFTAPASVLKGLPEQIEAQIAKKFGHRPPVILRTGKELAAIAQANPFLKRGEDADRVHIMFLAEKPAASAVKALDRQRCPPDEFEVRGKEVYLFLPNGVGRSKLTNAYFDSKLSTISTIRNWRTLLTLLDWTKAQDPEARLS